MKRDLRLCQEILIILERDEKLENTPQISNHLLILADAGYVKLDLSWMKSMKDMPIPRLTWRGHEALLRWRSDGSFYSPEHGWSG